MFMMNSYIRISVLLLSCFSFGQVGIGTENPQATLDVQGSPDNSSAIDGVIAPRITGEQLKSKDAIYTSAQDGSIVYVTEPLSVVSDKTKKVLQKGYYNFDVSLGSNGEWKRMFFSPKVIAGADGQNAYSGSGLVLRSRNEQNTQSILISRNFEIKEKSLILISATCPAYNILNYNGGLLNDGASKLYGFNLSLTGNDFNNTVISRDAASFTNSANSTATGFYQLKSVSYIALEPGTYTVDLSPFVYARDSTGVRVTFGTSSATNLDILSFPID